VEVPFPVGSLVLVGGGVDGAVADEDCAEMSVAKVRKILMSSMRIEKDILAVGGDSNNERTTATSEQAVQEQQIRPKWCLKRWNPVANLRSG
jgi:hypothetical protein